MPRNVRVCVLGFLASSLVPAAQATQASAASNRLRIEFVFDVASPHSVLAWRVLSNYTSTWHSRATISAVPVCMKTMMKVAGTSVRLTFASGDFKWFCPFCAVLCVYG
jgi:hypothetical protein